MLKASRILPNYSKLDEVLDIASQAFDLAERLGTVDNMADQIVSEMQNASKSAMAMFAAWGVARQWAENIQEKVKDGSSLKEVGDFAEEITKDHDVIVALVICILAMEETKVEEIDKSIQTAAAALGRRGGKSKEGRKKEREHAQELARAELKKVDGRLPSRRSVVLKIVGPVMEFAENNKNGYSSAAYAEKVIDGYLKEMPEFS